MSATVGREPRQTPRTLVECGGTETRLACGWTARRKSAGTDKPCPRCGGEVRWATDYTELRNWIRAGGLLRAFPTEDVHCGVCTLAGRESGGCLMYPDPHADTEDPGEFMKHRPSTICPRCSSRTAESYLRFHAERQGFDLKPVTVF